MITGVVYNLAFWPVMIAMMVMWQGRGPVSHFSFDTCEPIDLRNGGNIAKDQGSPACQCGVADFAPVYDGRYQSTRISGPVNRYFSTTDLTVSFYFKPLGQAPLRQTLLSKREACSPGNAFEVVYHPGRPGQVEVIFSQNESIAFQQMVVQLEPDTDWQHVAVTRQGHWAELYINGQQRKRVIRCAGVDITNKADLTIATGPCDYSSYQMPFNGVIDELAVFNYALSPVEMNTWYQINPVERAETDCMAFFSPDKP